MRSALALLALCVITTSVRAQAPAPNQPDPLKNFFFAPELVMAHQAEIGLNDDQRKTLRSEIQQAQAFFTDTQWKLSEQAEALGKLLGKPNVDEGAVLAQVDKILTLEYGLKRMQMRLMVRIKNALTVEQQNKLTALRGKDE